MSFSSPALLLFDYDLRQLPGIDLQVLSADFHGESSSAIIPKESGDYSTTFEGHHYPFIYVLI